jgi:hypothetical protein
MAKRAIEFISPQRSQQLTDLADRAKLSLTRFAGMDIGYDAVGLQTLDEWIESHLHQFPQPSQKMQTIWSAFLGEAFRRRYQGQWGIDRSRDRARLGVICPRSGDDPLFVDVCDQVVRRVRDGISESLAFYYTMKGIEIKSS